MLDAALLIISIALIAASFGVRLMTKRRIEMRFRERVKQIKNGGYKWLI